MDEKNECRACGQVWWAERADSWLAGAPFTFLGQASPDPSRRTFSVRPLMAVAAACIIMGFSVLKELARRIGH